MSCILNIETSTDVCSVAVSNDAECIFNLEDHNGPNHAVKLGVFVEQALAFIDNHAIALDAVPVLLAERVTEPEARLCPMLDARRMEVYAQVFDRALHEVRPISADIVDADTYRELLDQGPIYFFGNGAAKCMEAITHPNAHFIEGIEPLAKNMFPLAEKRIAQQQFEDVAYFVPFYLKDFVAKEAKKLL